MISPELCAILIIAFLSLVAVTIAGLWAQHNAYERAFAHFRGLVMPGVTQVEDAQQTLKDLGLVVDRDVAEDQARDEMSNGVFEHLSPLARPYMAGYAFATPPDDDEGQEDTVEAELAADIQQFWEKENRAS